MNWHNKSNAGDGQKALVLSSVWSITADLSRYAVGLSVKLWGSAKRPVSLAFRALGEGATSPKKKFV